MRVVVTTADGGQSSSGGGGRRARVMTADCQCKSGDVIVSHHSVIAAATAA